MGSQTAYTLYVVRSALLFTLYSSVSNTPFAPTVTLTYLPFVTELVAVPAMSELSVPAFSNTTYIVEPSGRFVSPVTLNFSPLANDVVVIVKLIVGLLTSKVVRSFPINSSLSLPLSFRLLLTLPSNVSLVTGITTATTCQVLSVDALEGRVNFFSNVPSLAITVLLLALVAMYCSPTKLMLVVS